jgi:predicted deacylase
MNAKHWLVFTLILTFLVFSNSCQTWSLVSQPAFAHTTTAPSSTASPTQPVIYTATPQFTLTAAVPRPTRTSIPSSTIQPSHTPLPFASGPLKLGFSAGGRQIDIYRFGTGSYKQLILAGIHGGYEWNTTILAYQIIDYIEAHPEIIPSGRTLFIIPVFNPDGEARGHGAVGRANDHGVDLNRNFPVNWEKDWNRSGCWQLGEITAGEYPLSEPESAALASFLTHHSIKSIISYHSAGLGIFPGGDQHDPASVWLAETIANVSEFPYPPIDTGCQYTGMLADYAVEKGIAAVDIELSTHWDTEFSVNLIILQSYLIWEKDSWIQP